MSHAQRALAGTGGPGLFWWIHDGIPMGSTATRSRAVESSEGQQATSASSTSSSVLASVGDPAQLDQQERRTLALISQESQVETIYQIAQQLRALVKERKATSLQTWLDACIGSQIVELEHFAQGLQKEFSAFQSALTLPYSNGPVEGVITKVKCIKRSMYGRGDFPLLRQRVLKAA
jgi:transposase